MCDNVDINIQPNNKKMTYIIIFNNEKRKKIDPDSSKEENERFTKLHNRFLKLYDAMGEIHAKMDNLRNKRDKIKQVKRINDELKLIYKKRERLHKRFMAALNKLSIYQMGGYSQNRGYYDNKNYHYKYIKYQIKNASIN